MSRKTEVKCLFCGTSLNDTTDDCKCISDVEKMSKDAVERLIEIETNKPAHLRYSFQSRQSSLRYHDALFKIIRIQYTALEEGSRCHCDCRHSLDEYECISEVNRIAKEILE